MQIKEVCEITDLSRRTIRYYEEQGLIRPETETRNGRIYRNYSESDVQQLMMVASLRKAWFTIDEIKTMQQDPKKIAEIVHTYLQWLQAQQQTLRGLIFAAEQLQPDQIASVEELTRKLSAEAKKLPLPQTDVEPHFKYLDAMEASLPVSLEKTRPSPTAPMEIPVVQGIEVQKRNSASAVDKHQKRKKLFITFGALCMIILLVFLVNFMLDRDKTRDDGTVILDAEGYVGVAARNGQCFLVDTSGCIY